MADAHVVSIRGVQIWTGEADKGIESVLTDLLERVRAGEVIGVAFAAQYRDNSSYHASAGAFCPAIMAGRLALLQHKMITDAS